jgi:hypothetical protein
MKGGDMLSRKGIAVMISGYGEKTKSVTDVIAAQQKGKAAGILGLAVIGVIARQHHKPDPGRNDPVQRCDKGRGTFVESPGGFGGFGAAAEREPLTVQHHTCPEIALRVVKMRIRDNGKAEGLAHQGALR